MQVSANSNDSCQTPADSSLRVDDARQRILSTITPISDTTRLPLRDALGRVLGESIHSPYNVPSHTNSAMDGYAFAGDDLPTDGPRDYRVIGTALAGQPFGGRCGKGEAVRIMTGASIPAGCDTVVMQEQALTLGDDGVRIEPGHKAGQNVRLAGEDIAIGDCVLPAGRVITPADLGVLASMGTAEVRIRRRPRVAFFSTGDELRSVGEPLREGDVYDSNRYTLHGMLRRSNVDLIDLGVVPDQPELLREAFRSASRQADVVITSGGVSVGDADYVKDILAELGDIGFWRIAMKPGRPLAFGRLGNGHFFGLPGNPVAVMVTFELFVRPALHYLASGQHYRPLILKARAETAMRKRPGRFEFVRAVVRNDDEGELRVDSSGGQGSGILTSMSRANCLVLLDEDNAGVQPGDSVKLLPLGLLQPDD